MKAMDYLPSRQEIERRRKYGITLRDAEIWLAAELAHAAKLLRKEEPPERQGTKEDMRNCIAQIKRQLDIIADCVRDES